jgi:hypothetical protein
MSQSKAAIKEDVKFLRFFHRYGWTALFLMACFILYSQGMQKKADVCSDLKGKIRHLESLKQVVLAEREDLALQIHSQSDSDWIEMVLKKRLGVVPEGQMKVYFKTEE